LRCGGRGATLRAMKKLLFALLLLGLVAGVVAYTRRSGSA
jgi:hypothetical protein